MNPSPLGPHFLHRIVIFGVKIRTVLKKYFSPNVENVKADIAKIIILCENIGLDFFRKTRDRRCLAWF